MSLTLVKRAKRGKDKILCGAMYSSTGIKRDQIHNSNEVIVYVVLDNWDDRFELQINIDSARELAKSLIDAADKAEKWS